MATNNQVYQENHHYISVLCDCMAETSLMHIACSRIDNKSVAENTTIKLSQ